MLIVLGDTICDYNIQEVLQSPHSMIGVRKVDDPRSFGVAEIDEHDRVLRVIEKPVIPRSNMAMVGVYYVKETGRLFAALNAHIGVHANNEEGEYHLKLVVSGDGASTPLTARQSVDR